MTVMTMGATAVQMPAGAPSEMSQSASGSESVVEATMAEKKPTSVMATWMAARNWPESPESSSATLARLSPSSASCSRTARFAATSADSDIEK